MPSTPLRDIEIYYEEAGSGPPLLLIMGLGGDLQAWYFQARDLSPKFRVVTFDNRGAGRTSAPDKPYSIPGMAEDAVSLMGHLGIGKAHVLGFSMGGYIAQELALAHPDKVERLVLMATAPYPDGYNRNLVRAWSDVRRSNLSREQIARLTAGWLYSPELLDDPERFERALANTLANPYPQQDHAFLRQAAAILEWDARDRVAKIQQQTLVLVGKDDILVPPRNSERLASTLPNATLTVLPGGHIGAMEYPDEWNAAILEFLATK